MATPLRERVARSWSRLAPRAVVEVFVAANLGFLALDVWVAHSFNAFAHPAEWIPIGLSAAAPVFLALAWKLGGLKENRPGAGLWLGLAIGGAAIAVGVAGMAFHLESQFFQTRTMAGLVYTAPFVAPLAYAGLGLLLILDRTVAVTSAHWPRWVAFLAAGGFAGNFVLSLADHAQNGFFHAEEWIPVISSAFGTAFVATTVVVPGASLLRRVAAAVMVGNLLVGVLGFVYHFRANAVGPMDDPWEDFLYGAPVFAPLLFPNLAVLALAAIAWLGRAGEPR